jgi:hypothetical protein
VFYTIHHLYLTRFGVYFVVFNMEELSESAKVRGFLHVTGPSLLVECTAKLKCAMVGPTARV